MVSDEEAQESVNKAFQDQGRMRRITDAVSLREIFAWLILIAGLSVFGWALWRLQRADYLAALLAIATGSSITRASLSLLRPHLSE